jgi:DUF917 family protein
MIFREASRVCRAVTHFTDLHDGRILFDGNAGTISRRATEQFRAGARRIRIIRARSRLEHSILITETLSPCAVPHCS